MFGVNGGELVVLLVVIVIVVGPQRLPEYAEQLARLVKSARSQLSSLRGSVSDAFSEDGEPVDWSTLDPRRYDPRRIVRDALAEDIPVLGAGGAAGSAAGAASHRPPAPVVRLVAGERPPFDEEAT